MNWRPIARHDARDGIGSTVFWLLLLGLTVIFLGLVGLVWNYGESDMEEFLELALPVVELIVPLLAVVMGYRVVIGAVSSGTIGLLMSLPHRRLDLAIGSFVGRSVVLGVPLLVALVLAGIAGMVLLDGFDLIEYTGFILLTLVLGISFLGIAIGLSMASDSSRRVTALAFGAYILLVIMWQAVASLVVVVVYRFNTEALMIRPEWGFLLEMLSPVVSFQIVLDSVISLELSTLADEFGAPGFVTPSVAMVILIGWIAVSLTLGYLRFARTELV